MERQSLSLAGSPSSNAAQRVDFDTREQWEHVLDVIRKDLEECVEKALLEEGVAAGKDEVMDIVNKTYLEPLFKLLAGNTTINSMPNIYPNHVARPQLYAPKNEELHLQVENYQEKLFGVMMKNTTDRKRLPDELGNSIEKLLGTIEETLGSKDDVMMEVVEDDKGILASAEGIKQGMETVDAVLKNLPVQITQAEQAVQVQKALRELKERP
ncbi:hypothetical protein BT69DRAFT_1286225 [Atractiella rhizophila]|nr:hypothetical protein BT69DRAFT_1286549 [Atractiella rhizophila]KAH8917871.1 hypothetical protein BT69DRAFT_1286225 [Atractiella rhizophila]